MQGDRSNERTAELKKHLKEVVNPYECNVAQEKFKLPYIEFFEDCERRTAVGENQDKCEMCSRYRYPHERCHLFAPVEA